jgi:hypothetical protein
MVAAVMFAACGKKEEPVKQPPAKHQEDEARPSKQ